MTEQGQEQDQTAPTPPPTPQREGAVSGLTSGLDSLRFIAFLVHPDQRPFSEYDGEIPDKYREMLYGLAQTAEQFGFDADMNGDVTSMINSLTAPQMIDILKGIDKDAFVETYNNHEEIRQIVSDLAQPLMMQRLPEMTLEEASSVVGNEIVLGENLGSLTVSQILEDPESLENAASSMGNEETLALLDSLPDDLKNGVLEDLGKNDDGEVIADLDLSGMSIEEAITARAEYEEGAAYFGLASIFNDENVTNDSTINAVYDVIRTSIPERLTATLQENLASTNSENIDIDPETLHGLMQEELAKENGGSIGTLLTEERMSTIKRQLAEMDDHSFLVNLLPQEMKDEAIFNKLRETMSDYGLLGPAGSIMMQLAGFVVNMLESFAPGIIGQDNTDNLVATMQEFIDPQEAPQPVVDPPVVASADAAASVDPTTVSPTVGATAGGR